MRINPLEPDDLIHFVAPSGAIGASVSLRQAVAQTKAWGFRAILRLPDARSSPKHYAFAGSDAERLQHLQHALDDPAVRAIICLRGGYGLTRILDQLDFSRFHASPKWVVGFSDITALHLKLQALGFPSIHGPMPAQWQNEHNTDTLYCALSGRPYQVGGRLLSGTIPTHTTSELVGGNLSLVVDSLGTATEIQTRGKILFLEETQEAPYRIDRMLCQLQRAGKLDQLAGCALGDLFSDHKPEYTDLLLDYFGQRPYPVVAGLMVGHCPTNLALRMGSSVALDTESNGGVTLSFPAICPPEH